MNDQSVRALGPDFRSDNVGAAAPEIVAALAAANRGTATSYGGDDWSLAVKRRFGEIFETEVEIWPVATGTAANALALAALCPSHGVVYCHENAHVNTSETNATSFFSGGGKLNFTPGPHGKVAADGLAATLAAAGTGLFHRSQPAVVTMTQASDWGACYRIDEVRAVSEVAKRHGLKVHMDGARLANALAFLGCTPAELTWKSGVDALSFGMTKNGGLLCDAIVVFDRAAAPAIAWQLRRAGQIWSKGRFAAAQLLAYVEEGLWLRNAARANALAARIDAGLETIGGVSLHAPIEANEVFLRATPATLDALAGDGIRFVRRASDLARFVCQFDGSEADVDALLASLRRHTNG